MTEIASVLGDGIGLGIVVEGDGVSAGTLGDHDVGAERIADAVTVVVTEVVRPVAGDIELEAFIGTATERDLVDLPGMIAHEIHACRSPTIVGAAQKHL